MDTMVAKIICGPDADDMYNFHKGEKDPGLCKKCGTRLEMIPNPNYRVRIKGRDFQNTYDGYYIVSERFKSFCEQNNYPDLSFTQTKTKGYYTFLPQKIYQTSSGIGITYSHLNECCNLYSHVYVSHHLYVRDKNFIQEGDDFIARTEILYGDRSYKHYMIVIGNKTYAKMKEFGLKIQHLADVCSLEYYLKKEPELIRREEIGQSELDYTLPQKRIIKPQILAWANIFPYICPRITT